MESNTIYYVEEHVSCKNFSTSKGASFKFIRANEAGKLHENSVKSNLLIFFVKGSFHVSTGTLKKEELLAGNMLAVAEGTKFRINYSAGSELLLMSFKSPASACTKAIFYSYIKYVNAEGFKDMPLSINPPMGQFIQLMDNYLKAGANCAHLHDMKCEELFLALRWFYTKEQLGQLFYRVITESCSFRRFVLDNYMKFGSVSEMIEASNMGKSAFYEKFKQTFSVSAKQWLLSRQKQLILNRATDPDMTAKDLMIEFGFSSPAHLTTFCKKQFGMTPSELISLKQIS